MFTVKPTECPVCGVKLSAKQALDQHMRLHTNECPYVCDWPDCNRVFKQRSALSMDPLSLHWLFAMSRLPSLVNELVTN